MSKDVDYASVFGGCPVCGGGAFTYAGRKICWHYCPSHRVRWDAGNMLSDPFREDDDREERYAASRARLADMEVVEGWLPPQPLQEAADFWRGKPSHFLGAYWRSFVARYGPSMYREKDDLIDVEVNADTAEATATALHRADEIAQEQADKAYKETYHEAFEKALAEGMSELQNE